MNHPLTTCVRGCLAGASLLMAIPAELLADPAPTPAVTLPAATGPLADQVARELAAALAQSGTDGPGAVRQTSATETDLELAAEAEDLSLLPPADGDFPRDPLAAYQARQGKPSSGWRLNYDRYWEEVTFSWRVGF